MCISYNKAWLGLIRNYIKYSVVGIIKTYMCHRFLYVSCVDGAGRVAVPGLYFYGLPEARARSAETALVPAQLDCSLLYNLQHTYVLYQWLRSGSTSPQVRYQAFQLRLKKLKIVIQVSGFRPF